MRFEERMRRIAAFQEEEKKRKEVEILDVIEEKSVPAPQSPSEVKSEPELTDPEAAQDAAEVVTPVIPVMGAMQHSETVEAEAPQVEAVLPDKKKKKVK